MKQNNHLKDKQIERFSRKDKILELAQLNEKTTTKQENDINHKENIKETTKFWDFLTVFVKR